MLRELGNEIHICCSDCDLTLRRFSRAYLLLMSPC